jgi:hypothetical protein
MLQFYIIFQFFLVLCWIWEDKKVFRHPWISLDMQLWISSPSRQQIRYTAGHMRIKFTHVPAIQQPQLKPLRNIDYASHVKII